MRNRKKMALKAGLKSDHKIRKNRDVIKKIKEKEEKLHEDNVECIYQRKKYIEIIREFWPIVFFNHPELSPLFSQWVKEAFKHLTNFRANFRLEDDDEPTEDDDRGLVYSFIFEFDKNPYFENNVLTKKIFEANGDWFSECDQIIWKEGQNLIQQFEQSNDTERESAESFFAWLTDVAVPEKYQDINRAIADDLWDRPFYYFNKTGLDGSDVGEDE